MNMDIFIYQFLSHVGSMVKKLADSYVAENIIFSLTYFWIYLSLNLRHFHIYIYKFFRSFSRIIFHNEIHNFNSSKKVHRIYSLNLTNLFISQYRHFHIHHIIFRWCRFGNGIRLREVLAYRMKRKREYRKRLAERRRLRGI